MKQMIFFVIYFLFIIWALYIRKENDFTDRIECLLIINICSIGSSSYSGSISSLYLLLLIQIITFIVSIKILKTFRKKEIYYIFFLIISICTILSITCSYGYYYYNKGMISIAKLENIYVHAPYLSNVINGILFNIYLFLNSLKYFFCYSREFVQQTQFYIGIILSCIILESIFSFFRNIIIFKE